MDTDTTVCQVIHPEHVGSQSNEIGEVLALPMQNTMPNNQREEGKQCSRDLLVAPYPKEHDRSIDPSPAEHGQPQEQTVSAAREFPVQRYMTSYTCDYVHYELQLQETGCRSQCELQRFFPFPTFYQENGSSAAETTKHISHPVEVQRRSIKNLQPSFKQQTGVKLWWGDSFVHDCTIKRSTELSSLE